MLNGRAEQQFANIFSRTEPSNSASELVIRIVPTRVFNGIYVAGMGFEFVTELVDATEIASPMVRSQSQSMRTASAKLRGMRLSVVLFVPQTRLQRRVRSVSPRAP